MSGPQNPQSDGSFQDRLNRVAERRAPIEAARPQVDVLPDWKQNVRYPSGLIGAAVLGMAAVFIARFARAHLMDGGLEGFDADITMVIDGVVAGLCSFLLFGLLRFEGKEFKAAQTFGIIAMICMMHNFVHSAPRVFSLLFSAEWTEEVIARSEPNSIYFRGNYFVLSPEQEVAEDIEDVDVPETPALPKVRRLG
ncbi:MAG: hypothetical protein GKR98_02730 [Boseongicola sp.]|nr:MAG: hypothetical protein GKR98_02730 [Boseongicola sp.]